MGVSVTGCGSYGTISGTVSYNGKLLKGGYVSFIPASGGETFSATIQEDGTYKCERILTGEYKVCVDTESLNPKAGAASGSTGSYKSGKAPPISKQPSAAKSAPPPGANVPEGYQPSSPGDAAAAKNAKLYVQIPSKYAKADSTDLTVKVSGTSTTFPIDLK